MRTQAGRSRRRRTFPAFLLALALTLLLAGTSGRASFSAIDLQLGRQVHLAKRLLALSRDADRSPSERALNIAGVALNTSILPTASWMRMAEEVNLRSASKIKALRRKSPTFVEDLTKIVLDRQVALLHTTLPTIGSSAPSGSLVAVVTRLLARYGRSLARTDRGRLERIESLPLRIGSRLAAVVTAFDRFDELTRIAFAQANPGRLADLAKIMVRGDTGGQRPLSSQDPASSLAWAGLDFTPVLAARAELLHDVIAFRRSLADVSPAKLAAIPPVHVPPVLSLDLTSTDDTYTDDYRLLIDAGGNDTYLNNAGGDGVAGDCNVAGPGGFGYDLSRGADALIDLGGDNRYVSGRSCGANGGGWEGAGFLYDAGGNDVFSAGDGATNGGAVLGLGFLLHDGGTASYVAGSSGTNGGSNEGLGALIETGGATRYLADDGGTNGGGIGGMGTLVDLGASNTTYSATHGATNGGGALGVGFLLDAGGDDRYSATAGATNGGGSAGAGFLFDAGGDDDFEATFIGTNGGADGGVGMLLDASGNNSYTAGNGQPFFGDIGTNGGAALGGVGMLIDNGGDAQFVAGSSATNGGGLGGGEGLLFHASGTATYVAGAKQTNGGAAIGGIGLLIDGGTDDHYVATGDLSVNGGADDALGLLFDAGGDDTYQDADGTTSDCTTMRGTLGMQVDYPHTAC